MGVLNFFLCGYLILDDTDCQYNLVITSDCTGNQNSVHFVRLFACFFLVYKRHCGIEQWIFNHNITRPVYAVKHIHFKYWPSQFKKHDKIVILFSKRHWYLYQLSFQKNMGMLSFFLCVYIVRTASIVLVLSAVDRGFAPLSDQTKDNVIGVWPLLLNAKLSNLFSSYIMARTKYILMGW
jgi:hypothetical protein